MYKTNAATTFLMFLSAQGALLFVPWKKLLVCGDLQNTWVGVAWVGGLAGGSGCGLIDGWVGVLPGGVEGWVG